MMHSLKRLGKFLNKPNRSAYFFIFPAAIILIVFTFVPLIGTLAFGFLNVNLFFSEITFAGFDNFIRFFNDTRAINSLLHSLGFMLWQVPLQISVGLLLAVALQKNNWFNKMCRSICFVPVVCSLTAISIIWTVLLNRNVGYIPHLIRQLGLQAPAFLTDAKWALRGAGKKVLLDYESPDHPVYRVVPAHHFHLCHAGVRSGVYHDGRGALVPDRERGAVYLQARIQPSL